MNQIQDETKAEYQTNHLAENENLILSQAEQILYRRLTRLGTIKSPTDAGKWLRMKLAGNKSEFFSILFLDTRNKILAFEEMFHGSIDSATVYQREVVLACLHHNAAAVILAHNHPSGDATPSSLDVSITKSLKSLLQLIDVRVLDHIVVGADGIVSLAEKGDC